MSRRNREWLWAALVVLAAIALMYLAVQALS